MAQQLPPDPQPYGSVQHPVTLDMWSYIVEVGWPGGWALVEMPTSEISLAPLFCYLVPLDTSGDPLFLGVPNESFSPTGNFYTRGQLLPKTDYADPLLITTAILPGGTLITGIPSTAGALFGRALHFGNSYFVTGPGIPAKTFFRFDGVSVGGTLSGTLSAPVTTPSLAPVPVKISDWAFQPFNPNYIDWPSSPPVLWDYTNWLPRVDHIANSGYWGNTIPGGFPLDRFDAVADTEDISGGVVNPEDWFGPIRTVDFFRTVVGFYDGVGSSIPDGTDLADDFFTNWVAHDDTIGGPRFHSSPKFGPVRAEWNRNWYILTYFQGAGMDTSSFPPGYKGWPLQSIGGVVPFTLAGPNHGDPHYPEVPAFRHSYGAEIWQVKFPTAAWTYQFLVDMRKVKELKIMQLATTFRSRDSLATAVDLDERIPGYPRAHGVTVRMFSGSTRFFLDATGRLMPVRVDATGLMTPANERWSHFFGPLGSQLGHDVELGRFDKAGPTPSPLPPGFP